MPTVKKRHCGFKLMTCERKTNDSLSTNHVKQYCEKRAKEYKLLIAKRTIKSTYCSTKFSKFEIFLCFGIRKI